MLAPYVYSINLYIAIPMRMLVITATGIRSFPTVIAPLSIGGGIVERQSDKKVTVCAFRLTRHDEVIIVTSVGCL